MVSWHHCEFFIQRILFRTNDFPYEVRAFRKNSHKRRCRFFNVAASMFCSLYPKRRVRVVIQENQAVEHGLLRVSDRAFTRICRGSLISQFQTICNRSYPYPCENHLSSLQSWIQIPSLRRARGFISYGYDSYKWCHISIWSILT